MTTAYERGKAHAIELEGDRTFCKRCGADTAALLSKSCEAVSDGEIYARASLTDYERGKRDGALEMRERCARYVFEQLADAQRPYRMGVAQRMSEAISALPVPGQPEKGKET